MTSFNLNSKAYAKNILKVVAYLDIFNPTLLSWYNLFSKKVRNFGELSGTNMVFTIGGGNIIKHWMFDISKMKANNLNDIRKFNNSTYNIKYNCVNPLFSHKSNITRILKIIKVLTNNDCEEWTEIVRRFNLVDSPYTKDKNYWEMFKYFCGGCASEHCSNTHVECARHVMIGLIQNTPGRPCCQHVKFGDLIDGLIYILETALTNIDEMEKERGYILYTGHQVNDDTSLLAKLPIELVRKINEDASKI